MNAKLNISLHQVTALGIPGVLFPTHFMDILNLPVYALGLREHTFLSIPGQIYACKG